MSETLYTCDCCVRNGNDEASCHMAADLCVIADEVVCDGCRNEEYPYDAFVMQFIPPHEKRIIKLEQQVAELRAWTKKAVEDADCGVIPKNHIDRGVALLQGERDD